MLDANKIKEAYDKLGAILSVAKTGQLDAAATEAVDAKLQDIQSLLFADPDNKSISEGLTNLRNQTSEVLELTTDLNITEGLENQLTGFDTLI